MTRTEATKILIRKMKEIKSDYIIGVFDNCIMSVEIQEDRSKGVNYAEKRLSEIA